MPRIYLCFLWHMHQPFYKDLFSQEYRLPWTRLHALKDYFGMVDVLRDFPEVKQTFNLVPSLLLQVEEYASGEAADPFLRCALKPAEALTDAEQEFILRYFFQANPSRLIYRFKRYGELYDAWLASDRDVKRARRFFSSQAFRDLQVLSQLAWFDEKFLEHDSTVAELVRKGRDYTLDDQELMGRKQTEILGKVLPVYREFASKGQIEISTTPFYHPILPLLCDSDIAGEAHPHVPLPSRFRYPQDARMQLERSRQFIRDRFRRYPRGLWPSEGSVSDEVFQIASELGFTWAATDNGVLARTLGDSPGVEGTYRPYLWRQGKREIHVIFRDHFLSDLVGFVYSRMGPGEAAADLLQRIRENCRGILNSGRDALVPVILDGENAWEYYERNGRPFLRELYRRIMEDRQIRAVTIHEALKLIEPQPIDRISPGSWINANFDVWIGAEEDNTAWEYLLRARQTYDRVASGSHGDAPWDGARLKLAEEELLIAEGSDWCWWYGPEHDSANRPEFDQLYRDHLANAYRALGQAPPEELSRTILKVAEAVYHHPPTGPVRAAIDGEETSFFEWLGAGVYRVDSRSGAMHGHRFLIRELHYGSDGPNFYMRLDLEPVSLEGMEARINIRPWTGDSPASCMRLRFEQGTAVTVEQQFAAGGEAEVAFHRVLEIRIPLMAASLVQGQPVALQVSIWEDSLPLDAVPHQGWLECSTAEPTDWPV
ncbi:MAG TPA: glycoside hydrolase family 57 protein [Bryobacteraceae bacterium]|nr:glycoside hydrolase family 57 protein [Bryobacteraceae bacterium]